MDQEVPKVLEDEVVPGNTPEDVAVLYSWANLQGAKYRDFSASRREYRAQLRHQAAEAQRQEETRLQQEAEAHAMEAERAAREAEEVARMHDSRALRAAETQKIGDLHAEEAARERALRHASEMSRIAAAERIEAARRSEAVAAAEAAARREEREMEEARASAERQAARYAESEVRMRALAGPQPSGRNRVPGEISDPYQAEQQTLPGRIFHQPSVPEDNMLPTRHASHREVRLIIPQPDPTHHNDAATPIEFLGTGTIEQDAAIAARGTDAIVSAAKGGHSPVHYYEPHATESAAAKVPHSPVNYYDEPRTEEAGAVAGEYARQNAQAQIAQMVEAKRATAKITDRTASGHTASWSQSSTQPNAHSILGHSISSPLSGSSPSVPVASRKMSPYADPVPGSPRSLPTSFASSAQVIAARIARETSVTSVVPVASSPVYEAPVPMLPPVAVPDVSQGQLAYARAKAEAQAKADAAQAAFRRARGYAPDEASGFFTAYGSERVQAAHVEAGDPVVPAWLADSSAVAVARAGVDSPLESRRRTAVASANPPVETLQNSRERVASRWYALKGVFDHTVQEQVVEEPKGERQPSVPLVAVFSLAGGVGKTSMVATLGRSLSATGEKVLLTDTTSHGLLPFYFGASELRPGVMRTFSPPAGSNDAAICLLAYDVMQKSGDTSSQEWFAGEITKSATGMARIILDLSACTPWVVRRLARMDATVIIPVAPDMNSVISLGPMEKFFAEMKDSHGKQVEPFYLLNGFDASLPLHLDVREVMRRQLDDRLLPFVIRRASTVPEALAEGMTVVDYAGDSAVAEDYKNLATWVKQRSAPAMAANKTARWSER